MKVKKAYEITDAKIQFVSLVDKAANLKRFLITKAQDGRASFSTAELLQRTPSITLLPASCTSLWPKTPMATT